MKPLRNHQTVLVVEDEFLVNLSVAEALRDDGFETVQAYSAEEALAILEKRSDVRVVFTDVNLPGKIDGIALAAEIQRRWPQIEPLMTSGQSQPRLDRLDLVTRYGRFFPKPYPPQAVARRIHDIIDAPAASFPTGAPRGVSVLPVARRKALG